MILNQLYDYGKFSTSILKLSNGLQAEYLILSEKEKAVGKSKMISFQGTLNILNINR